jgi:lipoate-protein ligase A
MAIDGALLAAADAPTLRLYGWQPHAVSLGYFQAIADFDDLPAETSVVRRATGGGAIYHGDELTYSLALDAAALPKELAASYALLHDAIVRALSSMGVRCHRALDGRMSARPEDRWCFAHPVQGDLMTDRGKLCGSAQRRERGRVLHHGSLVIQRPELTPFVAAIADQVSPTAELRRGLHEAITREIAASLSMQPCHGELDERESRLAADLEREVFGSEDHIARR